MLNFWKKSGQKEGRDKPSPRSSPAKSPKHSPSSVISNGDVNVTEEGFGLYISSPLAGINEDELDGDGESVNQRRPRTRSRLSKTLGEVLADKGALGYFIQFLQACEVPGLVRFWLDAESFRLAARSTSGGQAAACLSRVARGSLDEHSCECGHSVGAAPRGSPARQGGDCGEDQGPSVPGSSPCSSAVIKISVENFVSSKCPHGASGEAKLERDVADGAARSPGLPDAGCSPPEPAVSSGDDGVPNGRHDEGGGLPEFRCDPCGGACFSVNDAVRIYRKYVRASAALRVPLSDEVRGRLIASVCREDAPLDPECFTEAQEEVFSLMEREYFDDFLGSEFHCKHQLDLLTSGEVSLADVLYNDTALFYFMEFVEQEGQRGLLEFWLAAVNFQQQLLEKGSAYDPLEAQSDAMILYDKYFSLQATCPLGFSAGTRVAVEHSICREGGPLPDCFQRPVSVVMHVLDKSYLQPFLTSQLYFRYLSELINTIQANPPLLSHRRKTGSECSSELSISTQNTLLATEDTAPARRHLHSLRGGDMRIDARQLYDPDSLWRRRQHSGLSFGRINEIGRFETDFEPEPGKKGENRITKVMKKLVHMEEDKAKEELAWQIAEKIVKDITSLTLGAQDPFHS
ncbi:A-kinase anchor protein 10, mitochondrial [Bacillus rossius redtenbacheri]|uniref:A-kinase anchor protein 10, mitochondrial n=1 Tax=Bacillus rossius redtenbacheri TaxID=93214 RepID=UPI002FDE1418